MKLSFINKYSLFYCLAGFGLLLLYALLSVIDVKLAMGVMGAGILFFLFWLDLRWGIVVLLLSVLSGQIVRFSFGSAAILPSDGVMVVLLLVWILKILVEKRKLVFDVTIVSLLVFWVVSLVINLAIVDRYELQQQKTIWLYWLRLIIYSTCLPITMNIVNWYGEQKKFFRWFIYLGLAFLVLGFVQLVILPDISFLTDYGWDPHQGRLLSTFLDPNFAGAFLIICFAVSFSMYFGQVKWNKQKLWWIVLSGLFLGGIVLTLSRSALVSLVFVFGWLAWWWDKRLLLFGLFTSITLLINDQRLMQRVVGIVEFDETAMLRLQSWNDSWQIVQDNFWTGIGYNALSFEQFRRGIITDINVHSAGGSDSSYLTIWTTLGLIGLFFWLLIFVFFVSRSITMYWKEKKDQSQKFLILGVVLAVLGVMIHAQFTNSMLYVHIMIPVWFLMGVVLGGKDKISNF